MTSFPPISSTPFKQKDRGDRHGLRNRHDRVAQRALMTRAILDYYLSQRRPTLQATAEHVQHIFRQENQRREAQGLSPLRIPSLNTVRQHVRQLDPTGVLVVRHRVEEARRPLRQVGKRTAGVHPPERLEIDAWHIDLAQLLALQDSRDGDAAQRERAVKKGNPRALAGEPANKLPQALCPRVPPKSGAPDQACQSVGTLEHWRTFGTPEHLICDNGAAFQSARFIAASTNLGASQELIPSGTPALHACVERFFQTASEHLLAPRSTCGRSIAIGRGDTPFGTSPSGK